MLASITFMVLLGLKLSICIDFSSQIWTYDQTKLSAQNRNASHAGIMPILIPTGISYSIAPSLC